MNIAAPNHIHPDATSNMKKLTSRRSATALVLLLCCGAAVLSANVLAEQVRELTSPQVV